MPEEQWNEFIISIRQGMGRMIKDRQEAKDLLKTALVEAVRARLPEKGNIGVLFSGGVDSTLLAVITKSLGHNPICYSVGLEGAEDLEWAEGAAKKLGLKLRKRVLADDDIESTIVKLAGFLRGFDIIKAGVGCVTYAAAEMAAGDKCSTVITGLGSEEIFAGYQRHYEAEDANEECWKGLLSMWQRDLMRDIPVAESLGLRIETPFLDKKVIETAMRMPAEWKLKGEQNKIMLREAAEDLGVPEEFAWRKKRAAQYGSRTDKALARIAKKKGMRKSEYIKRLAETKGGA